MGPDTGDTVSGDSLVRFMAKSKVYADCVSRSPTLNLLSIDLILNFDILALNKSIFFRAVKVLALVIDF